MQTDRELLELAAKAAGIAGWQSKYGYWNMKDIDGEDVVCCAGWPNFDPLTGEKLWPMFADAVDELNWNPLTDDGDALRLAVKLNIDAGNPGMRLSIDWRKGDDPYAATRRAIVRAAAEIGESK